METVEVRAAARADAAEACEVVRRSIAELCHADHHGDPERIARWLSNKTPDHFANWIAADENLPFVALCGGRICGFAILQREGFLRLLYVAPEARFQGVSKAMLAAVEDAARSLGLTELKLESSYTARDFYLDRGYEPDGDSTPRHHPMKRRLTR